MNKSRNTKRVLTSYVTLLVVYVPILIGATIRLVYSGGIYAIAGLTLGTISLAILIPHFAITWSLNSSNTSYNDSSKEKASLGFWPKLLVILLIIVASGVAVHYTHTESNPNDRIGPEVVKIAVFIGFMRAVLYGTQSYYARKKISQSSR